MSSQLPSPESAAAEPQQSADGRREPASVSLSLALFGGAICWTLHLLFIVTVTEWGCVSGIGDLRLFGVTAIAWSVIAASLLALAVTGWAMRSSLRSSRTDARSHVGDWDDERGTADYLIQVAVGSNALFLFIIVAQTIPILFYLTEC